MMAHLFTTMLCDDTMNTTCVLLGLVDNCNWLLAICKKIFTAPKLFGYHV